MAKKTAAPKPDLAAKPKKGWQGYREKQRQKQEQEIDALDGIAASPEPAPDAKPKAAASRKTEAAAIPQLEVWKRRLVNPAERGSREVHLKQPGFEVRIINTGEPGRYQEAVHAQGWIPIRRSELVDETEIPGLFDHQDGMLRTGPQGVYLWVKMPTQVYNAIAKRKVEISQGKRRSAQRMRDNIMSRANSAAGDKGAEGVERLKGQIEGMVESIQMDPSDLEADMPTTDAPVSRTELA